MEQLNSKFELISKVRDELLTTLYREVKFPISNKKVVDYILKYETIMEFVYSWECSELVNEKDVLDEYIMISNRFFSETAIKGSEPTPEQITHEFFEGLKSLHYTNAEEVAQDFIESAKLIKKENDFQTKLNEMIKKYNKICLTNAI